MTYRDIPVGRVVRDLAIRLHQERREADPTIPDWNALDNAVAEHRAHKKRAFERARNVF